MPWECSTTVLSIPLTPLQNVLSYHRLASFWPMPGLSSLWLLLLCSIFEIPSTQYQTTCSTTRGTIARYSPARDTKLGLVTFDEVYVPRSSAVTYVPHQEFSSLVDKVSGACPRHIEYYKTRLIDNDDDTLMKPCIPATALYATVANSRPPTTPRGSTIWPLPLPIQL